MKKAIYAGSFDPVTLGHMDIIEIGANIAVRGLRNTLDFSAEYPMFLINRKLYDKIETVYLAADEEHLALSSTNVKEVAVFGGDISFMVPAEIKPFIIEKYQK